MNYPHSGTVKRSSETNGKYTFSTVGSVICFKQSLSVEESRLFGIAFSKSSSCYLPSGSDVQEGDRLIISGQTYGVKGVITRDYGTLTHMKAILEQL